MKKVICFMFLAVLIFTGTVYAEIDPTHKFFSTNIDDCYFADSNGWITGMNATYEISVKDASKYIEDYFKTYPFLVLNFL